MASVALDLSISAIHFRSMASFLHALLLALRDLARPAVMRLLLKSAALTLMLLLALGSALFWAIRLMTQRSGYLAQEMLDMASLLLGMLIIAGAWLLFRGVAIFVIGLLADSIVEDVESCHYPSAAHAARPVGFIHSFRLSLRSFLRFMGMNALALPFYLLLIPTAIGPFLLAWIVNAWLLGHDLETMVRTRHARLPPLPAPARWGLGLLSAASISVPVVNFLAPVVSAAMAVHLFHLRRRGNL